MTQSLCPGHPPVVALPPCKRLHRTQGRRSRRPYHHDDVERLDEECAQATRVRGGRSGGRALDGPGRLRRERRQRRQRRHDEQRRLRCLRAVRGPDGQDRDGLHLDRRPGGPAARSTPYKPFEECTGATISYEGSQEFEAQLLVRLEAGNPPDIAYIPQPGLLKTIVEDYPDKIVAASDATVANIDQYYAEAWKGYGSVDGTFYAGPVGANVKSFVWYSPKMFAENGYEIPTDVGRADRPVRPDRGRPRRRGRQAVVRRHRLR